MTCSHITITASRVGSDATCSNCRAPIIYDGQKWRWIYELDAKLITKMRMQYQVDTIMRRAGMPL